MTMRLFSIALLLLLSACAPQSASESVPSDQADPNAILHTGDVFEMTNKHGTVRIEALSNLRRSFTWDGATREVTMVSRAEPWHGALGLYWPGAGNHWDEHKGVTRGVITEQRCDFETLQQFNAWVRDFQDWYDAKYTPDGIVGGWSINLGRNQLNVELWRITIDGEQPTNLSGGMTEWMTWTRSTD